MKNPRVTRIAVLAAFLLALAMGCTPTSTPDPTPARAVPEPSIEPTMTTTSEPWNVPEHRIGVRTVQGEAEFFDRVTNNKFIPRGANYTFVPQSRGPATTVLLKVGIYDPERTREDFEHIAAAGFNTVRVFFDHCSSGPGCIGAADNQGLNPSYLDNIVDLMLAAKESGLVLLLTSNDLPDQGGYAEQANQDAGETFAGYRNSYYLTSNAVNATQRYWRDLLSGLSEREAAFDAVLGWELLNEQWMFENQPPLSLEEGLVETTTGVYDMRDDEQKRRMVSDGLIYYIAEVKAEILQQDPTALVTMGFFAPGAAPDWYVETGSLLAGADLDFYDFHAYPGWETVAELVQAFGMNGFASKPIILGEYGAFQHVYPTLKTAARAITAWQAASCDFGFDGWLYWAYYPADESVEDRTWGLVDDSGFFLDMLAPVSHPNPCELVDIPSENLAYQKPARASASLMENPPANLVDENASSQWSAGKDAPQWIEIDLGQPYAIQEIRLLVAQWPEGNTSHRILGRSRDGNFMELHRFSQSTTEGNWLVFSPEDLIQDIQIVRIETMSSPSWVAWGEVEIFGELIP